MAFRKLKNFINASSLKAVYTANFRKREDFAAEVIKKFTGGENFKIKIRGATLLVFSNSPFFQNEILLKKEEILRELKKEMGRRVPVEISFRKF